MGTDAQLTGWSVLLYRSVQGKDYCVQAYYLSRAFTSCKYHETNTGSTRTNQECREERAWRWEIVSLEGNMKREKNKRAEVGSR